MSLREEPEPLRSGDRVVDLAALMGGASVVSGLLAGAIGARLAQRSWPATAAALFIGGLAGFVVGRILGRLLYRTADGRTAVVRVGRPALPTAIRAGLMGSLASALTATGLSIWLLAAPPWPTLAATAGCGAIAGLLLSVPASLA